MCRETDSFHHFPTGNYYAPTNTRWLRINSFYVRFAGQVRQCPLPDSLTLVYLPRISGAELEINGTKIRPDSPAFITLYRVVKGNKSDPYGWNDRALYGCQDKVRAGAGLRFDIYVGGEKVLKGTFRKEEGVRDWKLECRSQMEQEVVVKDGDVAMVLVGVEGGDSTIHETVRMVVRSRRGSKNGFCNGLEEIPEESEVDGDSDTDEGDRCSCCGLDGCEVEAADDEEGEIWDVVNTDGVKWAVDVGIWVVCLGVGYLVSRASSKKLRRRRLL